MLAASADKGGVRILPEGCINPHVSCENLIFLPCGLVPRSAVFCGRGAFFVRSLLRPVYRRGITRCGVLPCQLRCSRV